MTLISAQSPGQCLRPESSQLSLWLHLLSGLGMAASIGQQKGQSNVELLFTSFLGDFRPLMQPSKVQDTSKTP